MRDLSISVAMCTFNGGKFLAAQLESIASQTRLPDELIVCDDGSADCTLEVIREFVGRSTFPVSLLVNEKNLGSTKNFENAISRCTSSIVVLADQDDVWYSHKLQTIESAFRQPTDIVAACSDADLIDDLSHPLGRRLWTTFSFDASKQSQFVKGHALNVLIRHPLVTGATMAFRKNLFSVIAPIPSNEVHDRWISLLMAARGRFEPIPEPLMQYRRHHGQQLGPGPQSLREKIVDAKGRNPDIYSQEIERFEQLFDRLTERRTDFPNVEIALKEIRKKIAHFQYRARLPNSKAARIPSMLAETLNRNYWRYSGGWKSIANDLFIR